MALFALVLGWWRALRPSNGRDWQPDVSVLPYADLEPHTVTIHNIRNCDYRTEADFDVRQYDKAFELDKIRTVDIFMVWWGSPYMAHTMLSCGFDGGQYLCFSIETRKQKGQSYSAIRGLFRQFELPYFAADEMLYERGLIVTNLPLVELKERAHVNARARAADNDLSFSRLIRQGVPGIQL